MKELLEKIDGLKRQIDSFRPLSAETLKSLREYYRIGLTWSSNALEGNTLTESETKVVIEDGITIGGKPLRDHLEASGHARAFEYMYTLVTSNEIFENDITTLHQLFYGKIDETNAGKYRNSQVFLSGSRYPLPSPEKIPVLMRDLINGINENRKNEHPVIAAARAHKDFVFIHPFVDGNGRVARLLMNLVLLQHSYTIALIPPVKRAEYIASLEEAHEKDESFITLIAGALYETEKDYIRLIKG